MCRFKKRAKIRFLLIARLTKKSILAPFVFQFKQEVAHLVQFPDTVIIKRPFRPVFFGQALRNPQCQIVKQRNLVETGLLAMFLP